MKQISGLVLEGGGMRGVFSAGVLDFFLDKNISFDHCIGVSAGACHACSFVARQKGRALATSIDYLDDKRYCSFYSLLKTGDIFGAEFIYQTIPEKLYPIDNATFLSGHTTFQAVITNCITGQAEYPHIKDFTKDIGFVRASSSLPFFSKMVNIDGKPYLDGGIADSIPIMNFINKGIKKNVIILTRPKEYRKSSTKLGLAIALKYHRYPKLAEQLKNRHAMYNNTVDEIEKLEQKGSVFVIRPLQALDVARIEKNVPKLKIAHKIGYDTAKNCFNEMTDFLQG